jgi:hypothetical protein
MKTVIRRNGNQVVVQISHQFSLEMDDNLDQHIESVEYTYPQSGKTEHIIKINPKYFGYIKKDVQ